MLQKRYGVDNLLEWDAQIMVGRARVKVHFKGGSITRMGTTPAECVTTDPFIQRVIENSHYFKEKRIRLLSAVEVPDDQATLLRKKRAAEKEATAKAVSQSPIENKPLETVANESSEETAKKEKIDVSCLEDAVEYLKQKYGYTSSSLRSRVAVERAATEHGIEFVYPQ